ncbi:putative ABC transporter [Elsinoe ampelina]|uniref:Putative ABC transporter n=1 Tax=Elsinoe ampelina TaxID=302913 RepID=A0A6A6G3N2_9PEZI|nr:putative ABC transporter [Elsinoe ampelina]
MVSSRPRLVATSQETRFHINEDASLSDIHVKDIDLAVVSPVDHDSLSTSARKSSKSKSTSLEILSHADLKLKQSTCYGLIGRNGAGKSTLLRAINEQAIPGMPERLRIACLQQTDQDVVDSSSQVEELQSLPVLEHVAQNDPYRLQLLQDLLLLQGSTEASEALDTLEQVRRYRRYQQVKFEIDLAKYRREAELRSGGRGAQAKKELLAAEAKAVHITQTETYRLDIGDTIEAITEADSEIQQATKLIADIQDKLAVITTGEREAQARKTLKGLGFDEIMMQKPVNKLSGGWHMRCMLATALLQTADLLILDEPTNFLDLLGIVWLQKHIESLQSLGDKTIVIVSHDRDFVDATCEEIIILRDKVLSYFPGNITDYETDTRSRIKYLTRMKDAQEKKTDRMKKSIADTVKQGKRRGDDNALRTAKSRTKKLENSTGLMKSATGGRFKLNRDRAVYDDKKLAEIEIPTLETSVSMLIPGATELRNAGALASLENATLKFKSADRPTLSNINLVIHAGDRIGIMGLNGSGKSTLIKVLTQTLRPSSGIVTHHPQLKLGYYSQHAVEDLQTLAKDDSSLTAVSLMMRDAGDTMTEQDARGLLGTYGLSGRTASDVPVISLSGGQLVRLALARMVASHPNLLVLDEISTHLDYHTVTALADALEQYDGAVVLVSHDRYIKKRVAEGMRDSADEDSDLESETSEGEQARRREVLLLKGGALRALQGGVSEFERSVEKMAAKIAV